MPCAEDNGPFEGTLIDLSIGPYYTVASVA